MPPAKKAAPAAAPLPPVAEVLPGDEAVDRYQAALVEGKTEDEAREIGWPGANMGQGLPEGHCGVPEKHERHDFLWGEYGSTDYRTCEGEPAARLGGIEDAGHDQPNAMVAGNGDWFYPDGPEDAAAFAKAHDARPASPNRWPWDWPLHEWVDLTAHCPTPATCFPYGTSTGWAGCIHGETSG